MDNQPVYNTGATPSISTYIAMTAGSHKLIIRAWDTTGHYASVYLSINVTGSTSSVSVAVSPTSASVQTAQTQQFAATVTGTTNTAVNWLVNGVQGGSSTVGTISAAGLYQAPATVPSGGSVTVTAKSAYDSTKSANATVSITASSTPVSVSISPTSASLQTGQSKQFTASVSGTSTTSVTWAVNGVVGGNSTVGTVSTSGVYTAPSSVPSGGSVTVTARSTADSTKTASAAVAISASTATGPQYYVSPSGSDTNSGSQSSPWRTIQRAVNAATAGSTVHIAAGTYYENSLTLNNSGTSTARIRVISDQKWGAKLLSTSYFMVTINGSYVDFEGFELAGQSGNNQGVATYGNYIRVINNHIHDIPVNTAACSNGGAGIDNAGSGIGMEFTGNVVHDIGWGTSCPIPNENIHGIYALGTSNRVVNNISFHNVGFGITAYHTFTNLQILNNTVFRNGAGGIVISSGGSSIPPANTNISNNISVYNTKMSGINDGYGIDVRGSYGSGGVFQNNLLYGNAQSGFPNYAGTPTGTITADPQFANYTGTITGDYDLRSGSPAIDKGVSASAPTIDIDDGVRPFGAAIDIGAYEYGSQPGTWPW